MSNQSSENYLDQLLNSVGSRAAEKKKRERKREQEQSPMDALERELFGEPDTPEMMTAKDEEAFLREFEAELLTEDIPNFSDDFMPEKEAPKDGGHMMEATDASIEDMLSHMEAYAEDPIPEPVVDEKAEFDGQLPGEPIFPSEEELERAEADERLDAAMGTFDENLPPVEDMNAMQIPLTEEGEADLSGMGDSDLMDILSGQEGMSDLGDMLTADSTGEGIDGVDEIGSFAEGEMAAQADSAKAEDEEEGKGKRKKRRKKEKKEKKEKEKGEKGKRKQSKLARLFFGEDEEEKTDLSMLDVSMGADVTQLSEENMQILKELENAEESAPAEEKGKKKKKDKKEKKKKEPKEKKEPKPKKPPKPKKEKKPKEKDNTPPLPRGPVLAILIMVGSLLGLVLLGADLLGYQSGMNEAKTLFANASYAEAFESLSGMEIKEKDELFYNKLCTLASVSSEYNTYLIFASSGRDRMALDALICAYGRYDLNRERAGEYECAAELEELGSKVLKSLLEDYDMTGQEALDIYNARTRKEYTLLLREKLQSLGMELE
ncbi:MAG: hypothetical protein NC355_01565 [Blautia sp.]|nr:hypothetical protein [Blautia sp.]